MINEITETKKLSDEKVLETKKLLGFTMKTFNPCTRKWEESPVELEASAMNEEKEMNEQWMQNELVALRAALNVTTSSVNRNEADISAIKTEMLQPVTGKRLWDGIAAEKTILQAQDAQDMVVVEEKLKEQQKQIDELTKLVESLIETQNKIMKLLKTKDTEEILEKMSKRLTPSYPPINIQPTPYQPSKFIGDSPFTNMPTMAVDTTDLSDKVITI